MNGKAAGMIRDCLEEKGLFQVDVSKRMGQNPQNLSQQLNQRDMKVGRFIEVMQYIGYEVYLKDCGFSRVTPQYGKSIIEAGTPQGLFWYLEGGLYAAIDSRNAPTVTKTFPDFDGMAKWFQDRLCAGG